MKKTKSGFAFYLVLFSAIIYAQAISAEEKRGDSWPMFLGDAEHSSSAKSKFTPPINLIWSFEADGPVYTSAAVSSGKVYFATLSGTFYALDAATGEEAWSFQAAKDIISSPAVFEDKVYFGSKEGVFYCLDRLI